MREMTEKLKIISLKSLCGFAGQMPKKYQLCEHKMPTVKTYYKAIFL